MVEKTFTKRPFYKFRSQREESRVNFDGTGISVFDLKKEIILANNLGKANDFDLAVYDSSSNEGASVWPCRTSAPLMALARQSTRMTRTSSRVPRQSL